MTRLILTVLLSLWNSAASATGDIRPDDFPGCEASRDIDTLCWQQALDAATRKTGHPYFGAVSGVGGRTYTIRETLRVTNAHGGVIDGRGAVLLWAGRDGNAPMFLFTNTQQIKITNLYIRSSAEAPLATAFEFTKAKPAKVSPRFNVLDHIIVDGTDFGGLQYGVRFSQRYGIDEDNDQATIINSTFSNVSKAAISIEHTQSHDHRLIAVNGTGAPGNTNAAFVHVKSGSFTSIGGFHGNFRLANYYLETAPTTITIMNENSEASSAFIKTPDGVATFPLPVQVIGGRFAVDQLQKSGRVIEFNRFGPLTIQGLSITGTNRTPAALPTTIHVHPTAVAGVNGYAELTLSGILFAGALPDRGTNLTDPVDVSPSVRVTATANSCSLPSGSVTQCIGLAAGSRPGVRFMELAGLQVPGQQFYCSDCSSDPLTARCTAGGTGRFARRLASAWLCN